MAVTIRPVEESDLDQWQQLWEKYLIFYKAKLPEGIAEFNFKRFLDPQVKMWSALAIDSDTNRAIGMVNYFTHIQTWDFKDKLLLNDLYVDEDCRLKGVGKKLIEFVYNEADKMGAPQVYWNTDFDNHRAQLLYTKVGEKTGKLSYKRPL